MLTWCCWSSTFGIPQLLALVCTGLAKCFITRLSVTRLRSHLCLETKIQRARVVNSCVWTTMSAVSGTELLQSLGWVKSS